MGTNLDRFKGDLEKLLDLGFKLQVAMGLACRPVDWRTQIKEAMGSKADDYINGLPKFDDAYQGWYSEAMAVVKQVLPDRLSDFRGHYEKPKSRKELSVDSYRIEDYLQGITASRAGIEIVTRSCAIPHFDQQVAILTAAKSRFESSLYDIRQLVQADVFDSEVDAAEHLLKHKFVRAAGALAGVVLERHLRTVCASHSISPKGKNPGIADLNETLKAAGVIDVPMWRFMQHLADIRNLCDHSRDEPTSDQVVQLIDGVKRAIKSVF